MNANWRAGLQQQLDQPPLRLRAPLALAIGTTGRVATIGSIETSLALRLAGAGHPLRDAGDRWQFELRDTAAIGPLLASVAQWLRAERIASAWRDELLAVDDTAGVSVGAIERAAVRPLGIATRAVHLVVRDARGDVWVQQRAFDKSTDPGRWDTTVGGLSSAGESSAESLARETWEEAGLRPAQLHGVVGFGHMTVRRPVADGYMVEHIEMFEALAPDGVTPVNRDGEVERFECIDRVALTERLHAGAFTLEAAEILARWLVGGRQETS